MVRMRLSDPGVKERLQDLLAAGTPKDTIAQQMGVSRQTLYTWLSELGEEMQTVVAGRKVDYAERLTERQFSLYDELARMTTLLQNEVAQLGQAQRIERTDQRALAIFKGCTVIHRYLQTMGELLGQLQPQPAAQVHLSKIEQLLNVTVPAEQIPEHLRAVVLAHANGDDQ
jgi:transposase-like protein